MDPKGFVLGLILGMLLWIAIFSAALMVEPDVYWRFLNMIVRWG